MKFRVKNCTLCEYGKVFDGKVVARYVNGYKVDIGNDVAFIPKSDMEILEISEEEKNFPIKW